MQTQLANIERRTGRTLRELVAMVRGSGLSRHGELRDMLKRDLGMGHGDANTLVHHALQSDAASQAAGKSAEDVLTAIYAGPKAALRPIHDELLRRLEELGPFEIAPKKAYVSLRRQKQFATVGPATNTRVEVGLNMKGIAATTRLEALPPGGMCQYRVKLTSPADVDAELVAWIRTAYEGA